MKTYTYLLLILALVFTGGLSFAAEAPGPRVNLSWTDESDNETGFRIQRRTPPAPFAPLATAGTNATSFVDLLVQYGTTYEYRVLAFNSAGDSAYSNVASATVPPQDIETPPNAPGEAAVEVIIPPKPGKLINISARAQVVDGDNILIGGFAIEGAAITVLVRGIGPSLDRFMGAPLLADPELIVFRQGGVEIVRNNDWENTPEVVAAMEKVFAFSLAPGSKDAVLLLRDLPPGTYTAHVRNAVVGSAPGVALMEVYEVKP